jgi:N-methylhydantoinase A/oxoprolinase/acetone carboxylase beta subunit
MKVKVFARESLKTGKRKKGPAIISEYSATTFVPQGLFFQADKAGNLLVEVV